MKQKQITRRAVVVAGLATPLNPAAAQTPAVNVRQLVDVLARLVSREYPDAREGGAIAQRLRDRIARYARADAIALAAALTADMRAVAHDEHLHVTFDPTSAAMRTSVEEGPAPPSPPTPREPSPRAREIFGAQSYGIAAVRRLAGNIGLLAIDNFPPLYDVVKQRYGAAMEVLADTYGLIIDLRENGGGSSDTPAHLVSYFFDREPFLLDRLAWRRTPAEESRTTRDLVGPNYGEARPLIVLTSRETFSAAEAVAYDLQAFGRARVVGQRSRGGANPGDFFNIGQGFEAFVPQGRVINAATRGNWEGVGVRVDVEASPADTLRTACRLVIEAALIQSGDDTRAETLRSGLNAPLPQ